MKLHLQDCNYISGQDDALKSDEINEYIQELSVGWKVSEEKYLVKNYNFENFKETVNFIYRVSDIFLKQEHYPLISIIKHKTEISFHTSKVNGLSVNDFIMAAKIDYKTAD